MCVCVCASNHLLWSKKKIRSFLIFFSSVDFLDFHFSLNVDLIKSWQEKKNWNLIANWHQQCKLRGVCVCVFDHFLHHSWLWWIHWFDNFSTHLTNWNCVHNYKRENIHKSFLSSTIDVVMSHGEKFSFLFVRNDRINRIF